MQRRHKLLPTYARLDVTFVEGDGSWLIDVDGKRYLDLFAGIAVVGLGHRHPAPLAAAHAQLDRLWHVSNLYWTEPMTELASALSDRFGGAQAFFCNSGAESIEAALKWARKVTGRSQIVALEGSFHGRTLGALSVTGQPAKRAAFEPLLPGARVRHAGDTWRSTSARTRPRSCSSRYRVRAASTRSNLGRSRMARELADEHGALLILDEVQTGVGRSGSFFAWQTYDVRPDAVTLAKGLANGLPIGALLVSDDAPAGFVPGDHASTFGGNPVACAAACAVVGAIDDELLAYGARTLARTRRRPRDVRPGARARAAARSRARPAGRPGRRGSTRARARDRQRRRERSAPHAAAHAHAARKRTHGLELLAEVLS